MDKAHKLKPICSCGRTLRPKISQRLGRYVAYCDHCKKTSDL